MRSSLIHWTHERDVMFNIVIAKSYAMIVCSTEARRNVTRVMFHGCLNYNIVHFVQPVWNRLSITCWSLISMPTITLAERNWFKPPWDPFKKNTVLLLVLMASVYKDTEGHKVFSILYTHVLEFTIHYCTFFILIHFIEHANTILNQFKVQNALPIGSGRFRNASADP